jgi:hypothetical protein
VTPAPAVPRSDANERAAVEPLRTVIAIRRAGVGVIIVVAPITDRGAVGIRGVSDCGANANTLIHLSVCRYRERQSQKHCYQNQAHIPHKPSLCRSFLPRPVHS